MEIQPFRAFRYHPAKVSLDKVLTQPYDKITPGMQARYYQASPYNLVRIILGDSKTEKDVYRAAAEHFRNWRDEGMLRADAEPSLYPYSQRFTPPGQSQEVERRGFIALGRIYDYSDAVVFRHELTHSKPKQDRLDLLRATRAQFEQLFMLYSDPRGAIDGLLLKYASSPEIQVRDEYGVEHRVGRCADREIIRQVLGLMADKKIIIADGHHRYETAQDYRDERAASGRREDSPANYAVMTFVNMDATGLLILPTHRVVHSLPGFDKDLFLRSAFPYFTVEQSPAVDPAELMSRLADAGKQQPAFLAVIGREAFLMRSRPGAADSLLAGVSARQRQLDLVHLHKILLEHVLGLTEESIRLQQNIRYIRDAGEALQQVRDGANIAFLVNPVSINQVRDIAFAGEVLPQKSTDFYPKLLSGLTIYSME